LSLKRRATFIALITLLFGTRVGAEEINIYFKTSPGTEQLRAGAEAASLALLVTAADGRPVQQGWVMIGLDAPPPGHFFSTDFPIVEGSRLAELRLPLRRGKAEWRYLFPIRGEYRMSVDYITTEGKQARKIFKFSIREDRVKWIVLGSFMIGLFILGFIAGRIFSVRRPKRERSAACLVLWMGCFLAFTASAAEQKIGQGKHVGRLEIAPARVGQPTRVRWRLLADKSAEKPTVVLTLVITHLEKDKPVFAVEKISVPDEFSMNFHFTDGAEYKVSAIADIAGRESLRTEQTLSVIAVEPPTTAMLPALALFLVVIAGGVMAGRWSRVKATPLLPRSFLNH
jgi:hypothetical protein